VAVKYVMLIQHFSKNNNNQRAYCKSYFPVLVKLIDQLAMHNNVVSVDVVFKRNDFAIKKGLVA